MAAPSHDQENVAYIPHTPQRGTKRTALHVLPIHAPKRAVRTYRHHADNATASIPFAPITSSNIDVSLLDQLDALGIEAGTRERIIGMHKQTKLQPSARRTRRSLFLRTGASSKQGERMTPQILLTQVRHPVRDISLERMRQLRVALATESPAWLTEFLHAGGLGTLLAHLDTLLRMQWREEQHDDTLLFEILRCMLALTSSDVGRCALVQKAPAPFERLCNALYAGELPNVLETRRMVVLLLTFLAQQTLSNDVLKKCTLRRGDCPNVPYLTEFSDKNDGAAFVAMLLHTPKALAQHDTVDFLQCAHSHRALRKYVDEYQRVCNEFFWIFCHEQNAVWDWQTLDLHTVHAPRVPSGVTGSVEWEAIMYLTAHLALLNTILSSILNTNPTGAKTLLSNLNDTNFADVLDVLRTSSQAYYPTLHAELAHYFTLSKQVSGDPVTVHMSSPKSESTPPMAQASPCPSVKPYFTPMLPNDPLPPRRAVSHIRHISREREAIHVPHMSADAHGENEKPSAPPADCNMPNLLGDVDLTNIRFS